MAVDFLNKVSVAANSLEISELNSLLQNLNELSLDKPCKVYRKWTAALNTYFNNFEMEALADELYKIQHIIDELNEIS